MSETEMLSIDKIELVTAGEGGAAEGLLGWLRFRVNRSLLVEGVMLRRTRDGRLTLSFPSRRDRAGNQRFYVRPLNDGARAEVERQVLSGLGFL